MDMLQTIHFSQAVSGSTHHCGHTLHLVVLWEEDSLLHWLCQFVIVCLRIICLWCVPWTFQNPSCAQWYGWQGISVVDRKQFRLDVASLANAQPDIIADQFNTVVQHFLDTQAPSTQHQVTHCHHLPWYSMKQERCWLFSGLTIHKEIMHSKHKISPPFTVLKSTVKELYIYINQQSIRQDYIHPTAFCLPNCQLPQVFSDFFVNKVHQIRDSTDSLVVHSPSHSLMECHFSGTPLCGFERVTKEPVLKFMKQMCPKTCVLDPIPTTLLSECSDETVPLLSAVANQFLLTGIFFFMYESSHSF